MSKQKNQDFPLDLNKKLNVAHINICTEAEGPYKRMAIWFQGCNIKCNGCCNPELQEIRVAHIMTVQEILDIAIHSKKENGIEGVTFLGGEPTLQHNLHILSRYLHYEGLGLILFTGKDILNLPNEVKEGVDLIVDGMFDYANIDFERNLIGSINQKITLVTNRYNKDLDWFYDIRGKKIEINMGTLNSLFVTGDVL